VIQRKKWDYVENTFAGFAQMNDISSINIRALKFFIDVYQSKSFSVVARRENVSPSMVSRVILQLEGALGQQLFYRNTRAIMPTEAGRIFHGYARSMTEQLSEVRNELQDRASQPKGLITGLLIFYFEPSHAMTLLDVPKWQLLGAMCGVPYIVIMVFAVQRIGTAVATVAVIFGQLCMSMLIDNFGWFGNDIIIFTPTRIGAIICLGIALYFIHASNKAAVKTEG